MAIFSNKPPRQEPIRITALISHSVTVEGNITFSGGMRIDGIVVGNISTEPQGNSFLVISETGRVMGDVQAERIILSGSIHGTVTSSESIEIQHSGQIVGDLRYNQLQMHGGLVEGRLIPTTKTNKQGLLPAPEKKAAVAEETPEKPHAAAESSSPSHRPSDSPLAPPTELEKEELSGPSPTIINIRY